MLMDFLLFIMTIMLSVAFFTILERKLLSSLQIRIGPNKVGMMGLAQPFSDAIKLFIKEQLLFKFMNLLFYKMSSMMMLILALLIWLYYPKYIWTSLDSSSFMMIICIISFGVYPLLIMGISSNSKYSMLGSMRSVAQTISYEINFILVILIYLYMNNKFLFESFVFFPLMMISFPLTVIFMISMLAELNRTPFDLTEGESELVSGFNTEYMAGMFIFIFIAEYTMIISLSMMFTVIFMINMNYLINLLQVNLIMLTVIWIRGTLPRVRYDILMNLAWKSFLSISIIFIMYSYMLPSFMYLLG
uniref:NADH-ubiquinone oxidoreductase chain 1 n=1 Tax=Arisubathynella cheongmiensis TaxID=2025387 RepID=A0A7R6D8K6_9CRUS|nr:NADH dehydrogenase subunit 1 [Arisubathynella cheongmiensis]